MVIREYKTYHEAEILPLYESVGWTPIPITRTRCGRALKTHC